MAVVASATGAAVFGLSGVAAGLAGGALLGAGAGALYSGITGDGDILNSALTGGLIGGAVGGIGAALAPASTVGSLGSGGAFTPAAGSGASFAAPAANATTPAMASSMLTGANTAEGAALANASKDPIMAAANLQGMTPAEMFQMNIPAGASPVTPTAGLTGKEMLGWGLAGSAALSLLGQNKGKISPTTGTTPSYIRPYTYSQTPGAAPAGIQYGANGLPILPTAEQNYFNQTFTAGTPYKTAATGGLMAVGGPVERLSQNMMGGQGNMYPLSQQEHTNFATPTQMPASAEVIRSDYDAKTNPYTGVMMRKGGKAESDDEFSFEDLPKAKQEYYLDLMASSLTPPKMQGSEVGSQNSFEKYMMSQAPQGAFGRAGVSKELSDRSRVRAGLSGLAMAIPGKHGVTTIPGAIDVGYNTPVGEGNVDLSAFRSINPMPGRGHNQGINARYTLPFNQGGEAYDLGDYSDGGRLLKGPGDGVSDDIPATIGGKQPARLADGEFVIPARIVSELGNGSTDAGAKRLYAMMDRIQSGRKKTVGKDKVAVNTKAEKHLPA